MNFRLLALYYFLHVVTAVLVCHGHYPQWKFLSVVYCEVSSQTSQEGTLDVAVVDRTFNIVSMAVVGMGSLVSSKLEKVPLYLYVVTHR